MFRLNEKLALAMEWFVWVALALIVYNITFEFDKPVEGYRYGATGWPRAVLIAIIFGATLQFIFQWFGWEATEDEESDGAENRATKLNWTARIRTASIFIVPLVFLWLLPRTGFYLTTPLFILAFMVVLDVKGWKPYVAVPAVVYGLILLIFTRLFYVALPVGSWQPFYDWNNAIIVAVRGGV